MNENVRLEALETFTVCTRDCDQIKHHFTTTHWDQARYWYVQLVKAREFPFIVSDLEPAGNEWRSTTGWCTPDQLRELGHGR